MDVGEKRRTLAALQSPECGFQALPGGVWTWSCEQEPLTEAVQAPRGSAFALSAVIGLPFVRLRAALPEDYFAGTVGQALGRRAGLSARGLQDAHDENVAAMKQLADAFSCCAPAAKPQKRIPAFGGAKYDGSDPEDNSPNYQAMPLRPKGVVGPILLPKSRRAPSPDEMPAPPRLRKPAAADARPTPSRLVGTALALAFCANAKTLSVVELARRTAAASAFFSGITVPGTMHGFDDLLARFKVLLSPGNMSTRGDWLAKARLWRLILLQQPDGSWRMTDSLAFAFEAHAGKRPKHVPKRSKLLDFIGLFTGDTGLDDIIDEALSDDDADSDASSGSEDGAGFKKSYDCPLTFSAVAMRKRLPRELLAVNARYEAAKAEAEARDKAARRAADAATREARRATRRAEELAAAAAARKPEPQLALPFTAGSLGTFFSALPALPFAAAESAPAKLAPPARRPPLLTAPTSASTGGESERNRGYEQKRERLPRRIPVERIWSTALALSVLEESDSSWLADGEAEPERTVVDVGRAFLAQQARGSRRVRRLLRSGALVAAAEKARNDWKRITEAHVAQLCVPLRCARVLLHCRRLALTHAPSTMLPLRREMDVINKFTALTHLQRASARVVRSVMTDHSTFAVFLDTAGYLARWQRFMILITLVLSTLLTSIWCVFPSVGLNLDRLMSPPRSQVFLLARRAVLRRDAQHLELRPSRPVPGLCGRLRRLPVAVCGSAGPFPVQRRPGRPAH